MTQTLTKARQDEKGFTLVELAVVLIIVGLLIGGVLKGQELIGNARVTSTVSEIKGIDGAVSTFRDAYSAFPGDMAAANTRLTGCSVMTACGAGDGNSRIGVALGDDPSTPPDGSAGGEAMGFYGQLTAADLITGTDANGGAVPGGAFPSSAIGGGYSIGYNDGTNTIFDVAQVRAGHYVVVTNQMGGDVDDNSGPMTAEQASRIDRKMDDGVGITGQVIGADVGDCIDTPADDPATTAIDESTLRNYATADLGAQCALGIRIQS